MNISITKEQLVRAVGITERLVGKKESLPVLSCILIDVDKECVLRATNLEAGITVRVPAEISGKGVVAVPASIFSQTLRTITDSTVSLKTEGDNLLISSRGTRTLIKAVPHVEFPHLSQSEKKGKGMQVVRLLFLKALQSVVYAASTSMIRPELGSVYLTIDEQTLTAVATDSFRLAEKSVPKASSGGGGDLLLPLKHAQELIHVLDSIDDESVSLHADESQLVVHAERSEFVSRVIDTVFPNYKDIIPKSFITEATVLKSELADVLKKARVFSGTEQRVGLHVYPKKKVFDVTAQTAAIGEMSDSLDAALTGEDIDINFHIGYIADCLPHIAADSVLLGFAGAGRPLVIRGTNDQSLTYLVMPLNR